MNTKKYQLTLFSYLLVPFIIFIYFFKWRTVTIYGDDLGIFAGYPAFQNFADRLTMDVGSQKFRPIHGLSIDFLITFFEKHLAYYYLFNIGIQTINTFILARILNLFLKSPVVALCFSLIAALSGFSLFNITQLLNGGALEGLAMTFLLLSVFYILKPLTGEEAGIKQTHQHILLSLLFANLSTYTHERYIVLFPFIILVLLLFPGLKTLSRKQKLQFSFVALASILLNVVIKKYIFSIPFFVGTAGTNISVSFSSAFSFLGDAMLSIFQINSGPEYLAGIPFSSLPVFYKVLALALACTIFFLTLHCILRIRKSIIAKEKSQYAGFFLLLFLAVLFALLLIPAVVTIRLEQRWLQGSFNIFIIMLVVTLSNTRFTSESLKKAFFAAFILLFVWVEGNYLYKGAENIYMVYSQRLANGFDKACASEIIRPATEKLYIWEKHRDSNSENAINWVVGGGYFFAFYQNKVKQLVFVDSIYSKSYSFAMSSFINFNSKTEQIIYIENNTITDITGYYLKDSLKSFISGLPPTQNQDDLLINNDNFNNLPVQGFYGIENGIRWTNGNASIGLPVGFTVKDSLTVELNTYMPPVCKNINPAVLLVTAGNKNLSPVFTERKGDRFTYKFYSQQPMRIQRVSIVSGTIPSAPDIRVLSFPFISMEIKK